MKGGRVLPSRSRAPSTQARRPRATSSSGLPAKDVLERQLKEGAQGIDLDLSSDEIGTLTAYCELMAQWNRAYNLIGARTLPEIVSRHVLDSLALSGLLPAQASRILDLGTGAGLPGLPLAVIHPEHEFTLLDRNRKKTRFVRQAQLALGISNIEIVTDEANHYRGGPFGCIMARAVGSLVELVQCSTHLIAADGVYLLPKGPAFEQELQELPPEWSATAEDLKVPAAGSPARTVIVLRPSDDGRGDS